MSTLPPLCRYCGKPIPKRSDACWFGLTGTGAMVTEVSRQRPTSKSRVEELIGKKVLTVRWRQWQDGQPRFIEKATVWDGETYVDLYFCNQTHAVKFAYLHARAGASTKDYNEAHAAQWATTPEGKAEAERRARHEAFKKERGL